MSSDTYDKATLRAVLELDMDHPVTGAELKRFIAEGVEDTDRIVIAARPDHLGQRDSFTAGTVLRAEEVVRPKDDLGTQQNEQA